MDKIELITQPEKSSVSESPQERTLQKLKNLVSEYQPDTNDEEEENEADTEHEEHAERGREGNGESDKNVHSHSEGRHSHDNSHQSNAQDLNEDSGKTQDSTTHENENDLVEYDDDGFEIPQGKIPLDGHFSTSEIQELIKLSKEEGILKDDVNIKVLDSNEQIGDKVVISEKSDKDKIDNGDKKGNGDGSNGDKKTENDEKDKNDQKDKKDENETKERSNSIDPKEKAKRYGQKSESE